METFRIWRITHRRFVGKSFSGQGARKYGGRFNSEGNPAVYTSGTLSLALLEMLVRTNDRDYLSFCLYYYADVSVSLIQEYKKDQMPEGWDSLPYEKSSQAFGDEWLDRQHSVVIKVPSVVVPVEWNYILNPRHKDFRKIHISRPRTLPVDERLFKS